MHTQRACNTSSRLACSFMLSHLLHPPASLKWLGSRPFLPAWVFLAAMASRLSMLLVCDVHAYVVLLVFVCSINICVGDWTWQTRGWHSSAGAYFFARFPVRSCPFLCLLQQEVPAVPSGSCSWCCDS